MSNSSDKIAALFSGEFMLSPDQLSAQLSRAKAYVFDWDGVFNDGYKDAAGSSPFSEIDAMGTNLLRFSHFLQHGNNPVFAIISGERNPAAFALATREHFQGVYFRIRHKAEALQHLCTQFGLQPQEIVFVYDDVLDLSAAKLAGLRVLVPHGANPLFREEVLAQQWADYLTGGEGFQHAVRETTELLIGLRGNYSQTIHHRMEYSTTYREYLRQRQAVVTQFFTAGEDERIQPAQP